MHGDPTVASTEKGKIIFEAVDESREWPIEKRSDQHDGLVQSQIRW